jgi:uncharacterized membrane protein
MIVNLTLFVSAILLVVGVMFAYLYVEEGSVDKVKERFSSTESQGIIKSMLLGVRVIVFIAILAFLFNLLIVRPAKADVVWFEETTVYAGIDWVREWSPQCWQETDGYHNLTSNMGVRQSIVKVEDIAVLANYTHHSCAVGYDKYGYDGVGVMIEWRIK